jgi:hypothetical protein
VPAPPTVTAVEAANPADAAQSAGSGVSSPPDANAKSK